MKKYKRYCVIICAFIFLVVAQNCIQTYAANAADTEWSYNVGGNSDDVRYTSKREKTNNSKAYMKVSNFSGKSDDRLKVTLVDQSGNKFSTDYPRSIKGTGEYSLTNMANEDRGVCKVKIKMWSNEFRWFYTWSANGVWSPDSIGTYK